MGTKASEVWKLLGRCQEQIQKPVALQGRCRAFAACNHARHCSSCAAAQGTAAPLQHCGRRCAVLGRKGPVAAAAAAAAQLMQRMLLAASAMSAKHQHHNNSFQRCEQLWQHPGAIHWVGIIWVEVGHFGTKSTEISGKLPLAAGAEPSAASQSVPRHIRMSAISANMSI